MAIQSTRLTLSAHYPDGRPIRLDEFLPGVTFAPYTPYGEPGQWKAVGLQLAEAEITDFENFGTERYEEYGKAVQENLLGFAGWLATIPADNAERLQRGGLRIELIVTLVVDQDQMEFTLPPELSLQLGRHQIRLYILSNE